MPPPAAETAGIATLGPPATTDGPAITRLVRACPPLDANSPYAYLVLCEHFSATCVVARRGLRVVGFISAYRIPQDTSRLFVWQVAVDPAERGGGLASRMLDELLARPACAGVTVIETTIGPANAASDRLFRSFAARHRLPLARDLLFSARAHFPDDGHSDEFLYRIGPRAVPHVHQEA